MDSLLPPRHRRRHRRHRRHLRRQLSPSPGRSVRESCPSGCAYSSACSTRPGAVEVATPRVSSPRSASRVKDSSASSGMPCNDKLPHHSLLDSTCASARRDAEVHRGQGSRRFIEGYAKQRLVATSEEGQDGLQGQHEVLIEEFGMAWSEAGNVGQAPRGVQGREIASAAGQQAGTAPAYAFLRSPGCA